MRRRSLVVDGESVHHLRMVISFNNPGGLLLLPALLLCAPLAAEESLAPLMLDLHELKRPIAVDGTIAVGLGIGALFAGPAGGQIIQVKKSRIKMTAVTSHPEQSHHASSRSVSFGEKGALTMLFDDRKGIRIVWYDGAKKSWSDVERPVGFVPNSHVNVGGVAVFPQGARAPAWFAFDPATAKFSRLDRPKQHSGCAGTAFSVGSLAAVAGRTSDKKPCALAVNPSTRNWEELPPPPVAACRAAVASTKGKTFFVNARCGKKPTGPTLSYTTKSRTWTSLPAAPSPSVPGQVFASNKLIGAWQLQGGRLRSWTLLRGSEHWTQSEEAMPFEVRAVAKLSPTIWRALGEVRGAPRLLTLAFDPKVDPKKLSRNRASLPSMVEAPERDWKTATEKERRAAVKGGLASVERYVPPEMDEKGKVVTQGAWVFALGDDLVVWPTSPKKCAAFINKMIAKWPTEAVGRRWTVMRGDGFARSGKKLLYGPATACRAPSSCATDYFSERNVPLSLVGPVFSYSSQTSAAKDCGDPFATEQWHAVDLRNSKPAKLTAVIKEDSMLDALKSHKTLRKPLAGADTLADALAILRAIDPVGLNGYAFGGWRKMSRRVEVRLEFHPAGPDHVEPIKVWVEPKDEFVETFEAAARVPGAMMSGSQ